MLLSELYLPAQPDDGFTIAGSFALGKRTAGARESLVEKAHLSRRNVDHLAIAPNANCSGKKIE
jgi:hypothetical protein